jgi:hypothetical protein
MDFWGGHTSTLPIFTLLFAFTHRLDLLDDLCRGVANSLQVRQYHLCRCTMQGIVIG